MIASVAQIDDGDPVFTFNGKTCINGWTKAKTRIDDAIGKARAGAAGETYSPEKHNLPHWTFHDLRRTVSTKMHENLAVPPIVVEATINHISGLKSGVAGTYNNATYLPQRREALVKWADYVSALGEGKPTEGIVYEEPAANVVQIRRAS